MNTKPVEAKVRAHGSGSTTLVIQAGGLAVQTEFAETLPCEFPIWSSAPVPVELSLDGTKNLVIGPFSGTVAPKSVTGDFPNVVKFPVYANQAVVPAQAYHDLPSPAPAHILAKMPVAALATVVSGVVRDKLVQIHRVVPIWNDGSAVLVTLSWYEGEPAEGTPNPEWHMRATSGLPAGVAIEELRSASRLPQGANHCRYQLHVSPWIFGARLLGEPGQEMLHPIWQREWAFGLPAEFSAALEQITGRLLGGDPSATRAAA